MVVGCFDCWRGYVGTHMNEIIETFTVGIVAEVRLDINTRREVPDRRRCRERCGYLSSLSTKKKSRRHLRRTKSLSRSLYVETRTAKERHLRESDNQLQSVRVTRQPSSLRKRWYSSYILFTSVMLTSRTWLPYTRGDESRSITNNVTLRLDTTV